MFSACTMSLLQKHRWSHKSTLSREGVTKKKLLRRGNLAQGRGTLRQRLQLPRYRCNHTWGKIYGQSVSSDRMHERLCEPKKINLVPGALGNPGERTMLQKEKCLQKKERKKRPPNTILRLDQSPTCPVKS